MKRNAIVMMFAAGVMLAAWQSPIAQSRNPDFDANGIVDFGDFILFAQAFGSNQSSFDLDGNGSVDFSDFILFATHFGEGMPEKKITITLPGGAKLGMVWIQPGRFLMGSPDSEPGRRDDEGPRHEVTITKGFYLGRYEITQAQWQSVMNTRPWARLGSTDDPAKSKYPARSMEWERIKSFIRRLNEAEGRDIFRLPTEAEWEYACRAGTTTTWFFGDDPSRIGDYARYRENSRTATLMPDGRVVYGSREPQETGGVLPNPWGLYDMYGNVREWVQDYWAPYSGEAQTDPKGPPDPAEFENANAGWEGSFHVLRGGYFVGTALEMRSAMRVRGVGWGRNQGFRLLMEHR